MQKITTSFQSKTSLLPPKKKDEGLRRAYSEISNSTMDELIGVSSNPAAKAAGSEVETVRCACCGVAEECTAAYIGGVRASFCGNWVCGLCAEAVKERMRRDPVGGGGGGGMEAALGSHAAMCRDFNATTRLNPKLSLAGSMRDIARKSFDRRTSSSSSCQAAAIARSVSCEPRFLT